ncbi:Protein CBG24230 [Caenorhabditis briggsae]|uniref:Protein CBG24230 n=1 Tax=Caenorhabditis briggsae TaxID=6238 RepID=A8WK96_CAEBR|nr:Protein CBG24230 [Caenorhabditis briggsae]CAP20889.2 Protein CBG24230 [Caenorhabditis briggsae]
MVRKSHCGYGFFLIIALLLTLASVFTPGWRSYKGNGAPDIGLISRYCGNGVREVNQYDCKAYGRFQLPFEKATLAFMIIAIILEIVSLGLYLQSTSYELLANVYLGYSYWIAVIAAVFLLISCSLSGTLIGPTENTEHLH